jgi:hypothetical protein
VALPGAAPAHLPLSRRLGHARLRPARGHRRPDRPSRPSRGRQRWGETELANPDFPSLAKSFGAHGERLPAVDALPAALARAFTRDRPTLLELSMEIEPPWEF